MNTTTRTSSAIERAVSEYSAAERTLRTLIENAEKLRSVNDALASSEKQMAEGSSAIYEAASELAGTARELKNTSIALRTIEPGRVLEEVAGLRGGLEKVKALGVEQGRGLAALSDRQDGQQAHVVEALNVMDKQMRSLLQRQTVLIVIACLGAALGSLGLVI